MKPLPQDIRFAGPMQPWLMEGEIDDCVISQGEVPRELRGGYYRNGPNMKCPTKQGGRGMIMADGMVHALLFDDGRVSYCNKWVRTPKYLLEDKYGESLFEWEDGDRTDWTGVGNARGVPNELTRGVPYGTAMTNVCPFNGAVLALGEFQLPPVAMDPRTLETIGVVPWGSKLEAGPTPKANPEDGNFTAHPKWDAATGTLYGQTYQTEPPYVYLEWVELDGSVTVTPLEGVPYASAVHDIWLTERYVVVPIQPLHASHERVAQGWSLLGWDPELPIKLALVERADPKQVRWIDTDLAPQYVLHTMSANHVGDSLVLDAPIYDRPPYPFEDEVPHGVEWVPFKTARMGRWVVDLTTGKTTAEVVDERAVEFPKMDERYYGRSYDNGFLLAGADLWSLNTLVKRNVHTGATSEYVIDGMVSIVEPQFAPRSPDAAEGDGYILAPVTRLEERRTDILIFDTDAIDDGPVATVSLPHQTPWTPHGCWMPFT